MVVVVVITIGIAMQPLFGATPRKVMMAILAPFATRTMAERSKKQPRDPDSFFQAGGQTVSQQTHQQAHW